MNLSSFESAISAAERQRNLVLQNENAIEFLKDSKRATVTLTQGRYVSKVRRLAEQYPEDVEIVADMDGVLVAHVPTKFIKISAPRRVSDEQKEKMASRLHPKQI